MTQWLIWRRSSAAALGVLLLSALTALAASNNPPPSAPYCYTNVYNSSGAVASTNWYPCQSAAPLWTANQAQSTVDISPANGVSFAPTKALFTAGTSGGAACVLVGKLVNDTTTHTWSNVQPGATLPYQFIDIETTNTTCTGLEGLY